MILDGANFCPECGGELRYYDKIKRIVRLRGHKKKYIDIKRYKCRVCGKVHRSITEDIFPFKQYEADIIDGVVEGLITSETLGFEDYPTDQTIKAYFKSDRETLRAAVNDLNEILNSCDYVSLNDFYDKIGLERSSLGDEIGWNVSRDGLIQLDITGDIAKDGRPCLGIGYRVAPRYEYSMYH